MGDPALVQRVSEKLAASGISTTAHADCPSVRVQLQSRGQQIHLRVTDAFQRLGEREVQDVATAAAIIESWTLQEIEAGMLPAEPMPAIDAATSIAAATPRAARTGVAVVMHSAVTDDSTTWLGGSVSACVRVGWTCVGAKLRGARDTSSTDATTGVEHRLMQVDALATVELPRRLGGFVVSPRLDVGYTWLQIASTHLDMHLMEVTTTEASHGLRAGGHLAVSRALTSRLALYGELAGDASLARTAIASGPINAIGLSLGMRLEMP